MVLFESLIVMDIETTSLPENDHNTTKITEIAFLACEVEHLRKSDKLPRVLHKLVLGFNPYKLIQPGASSVSGLTNELLMNLQPFRERDVDMVREFINRLPPPVCLIAHNGDNFDFPILRRNIEKLNKNLPNNLYCADSLKAFRTLIPKLGCVQWSGCSKRNPPKKGTPTCHRTQPFNSLKRKEVSRELFPVDDDDIPYFSCDKDVDDVFITCQKPTNMTRGYRLKDIYHFYIGESLTHAHRAEEDSKALLVCILSCKGFMDWVNENAVIFNSIPPLF